MTIQPTDHTPGVKRLHVLRNEHDTIIVFSQHASITAAAKREVIAAASRSGLARPINLIATCPIQSPQTLRELGLVPLQPLIATHKPTAIQRLRLAAGRVIACWEHGDLDEAVRDLAAVLADQPKPDGKAVTFGPMPDNKPTSGFLEIGDIRPGEDTYPWEAKVELLLGSDGRVYALIENNVDALPALDENGYALKATREVEDERSVG